MKKLIEDIKNCEKCELCETATHKVVGKGSQNPRVLFIGEAPGEEEDLKGLPFCGPSGRLLDKWIEFLELTKDEYAVINCLKCRPPENANPTKDQLEACSGWLTQQISKLDPDFIIALGRFSSEMVGIPVKLKGILALAGTSIEDEGKILIPFPHPSYYLRRGGRGWEVDMLKVKEIIEEKPTKDVSYVPLHLHTTYSVTDSCTKLPDLIAYAKELGMTSLGMTDHGTIGGWIEFQKECEKQDIKPLLGCEFYICDDYSVKDTKRYHLVAIAKNENGIKSIFKLDDLANRHGYYYKPRLTMEDFLKYGKDIVVTSACTLGLISKKIVDGQYEAAYSWASTLKKEYGEDFYLELQPHDFEDQSIVNPELQEMAKSLSIPLIVTTDSHYIAEDKKKSHDALKAIAFRKSYGEGGFTIDTNFIPDNIQLINQFKKVGVDEDVVVEAMMNTVEIAGKCNAKLVRYENALPKIKEE